MMELRKFVGIPFVYHGEDFPGCDCYGIVKLYCDHFAKFKLPDIQYSRESELECFEKTLNGEWREVDRPEPFDILVFRYNENNVHLGIMVEDEKMLTSTPRTGSIIASQRLWSKKIHKILRRRDV